MATQPSTRFSENYELKEELGNLPVGCLPAQHGAARVTSPQVADDFRMPLAGAPCRRDLRVGARVPGRVFAGSRRERSAAGRTFPSLPFTPLMTSWIILFEGWMRCGGGVYLAGRECVVGGSGVVERQ
ncbi:hypothetical protein E2C01_026025 [Portunus trituberculatus]|uniref:Uncharacterized protein n=1 Tax=Portunus trituberculatus TaxID=210409 RepID=A0A5B7EEE7_PORTR|nr:hypothetical protein [Portunus trituberculatus]